MSDPVEIGFNQFSDDLKELMKLASPKVQQQALNIQGQIVANSVENFVKPKRGTGNLKSKVIHWYNPADNTQDVGWDHGAFYGKFMDKGFTTRGPGKRRNGEYRKKTRYINAPFPHMMTGYEAVKNVAADRAVKFLDNTINLK